MQIRILKDAAISLLKKEIQGNIKKYMSNEQWLDQFFEEKGIDNYYIKTNLNYEDFDLIIGDQTTDAENAIKIHMAFNQLLPIHARDEKLWTYLTHTKGYEYMKSRWNVDSEDEKLSRIESRYFFQGKTDNKIKSSTIPYVRNGLSRLWWAGYIVYDKNNQNPYEYINELFVSQDFFVGLCERDIAKNKRLVMVILKCIRKFNIKNIEKNTLILRKILKKINCSAGLLMFDSLSDEELNDKIEKIFIENIS